MKMLKAAFFLLSTFLLCSTRINSFSSEFGKIPVDSDKDYTSLFEVQETKCNANSRGFSSLKETDNPDNGFCAATSVIKCRNPLYVENYHIIAQSFIYIIASLLLTFTVYTAVTFVINWIMLNRYPKKIIFYNNLCWAIVSFGYLVQYFPRPRKEIVCMDDDAQQLPESALNLLDDTFVFIYFFSTAAVHLFFSLMCAGYSRIVLKNSQKDSYYIIKYYYNIAWTIPFSLYSSFTQGYVSSLSGTYFVGYSDINMCLIGFAFVIIGYFLTLSLLYVVKLMQNSEVACNQTRNRFLDMMLTKGFIALCLVIHFYITFSYYKRESVEDYTKCLIFNSGHSSLSDGGSSYSECDSKPTDYVLLIYYCSSYVFHNIISISIWEEESVLENLKGFFNGLDEFCGELLKVDNGANFVGGEIIPLNMIKLAFAGIL